jgi:peptide/nickel transport system substrate-binding protein
MSRRYVVVIIAPAVLSLMLAPAQVSTPRPSGPGHFLARTVPNAANSAPVKGGTLIELGQGDMGSLDSVSDYVAFGGVARMFTRQLFGYPDSPNFAAQLVVAPDVASAIPTTSNGGISDGAKTYTVRIKPGVMWDTDPPRQVSSDDFVREFRMLCNPVSPTLTPGYFENTIMGMQSYCNGFAKVKDTVGAIDHYEASTPLVGVSAPNSSTVVFKLIEPASDFLNILALGFCSARPIEYMNYLPNSAALKQHLISDGPYRVASYSPGESMTFDRNPAWGQSTDDLRHAYVDRIVITEGLTPEDIQEQLEAGTGDLEFDVGPPSEDIPRLQGSPDLVIEPPGDVRMLALNQYAGPFTNKLVREAAEYAVDKNAVVQLDGGPRMDELANQFILPGNVGYIGGYNPYPDNNGAGDPAKARALLKLAGYPRGLTVKLISYNDERVAESLQSSLSSAGFHVDLVPATRQTFFGKYLENPSAAERDAWDLADVAWGPDWLGNDGRTTFAPLFTDPGRFSQDFGGYSNRITDSLVNKALAAPSVALGAVLWSAAERQVLADAAAVPVAYGRNAIYHSSAVHGCVYWWAGANCDPTNVWLSR